MSISTKRQEIVERHFGVDVHDPYRWLENGDDPEVKAWIEAQNDLTERTLKKTAWLPILTRRIHELLEIGSVGLPTVRKHGSESRYFYTRREGDQNQPVLLFRQGRSGTDHSLVDPNQIDPQGTTALDFYTPSPDGSRVAYGLSEDGSEETTLFVREVDSGRDLPLRIDRARFASVCWHGDGRGFFYTRYPRRGSVPKGEEAYHRHVFEHRLGTPVAEDPLVFGADLDPTDFPSCDVSPKGRWLVVSVHIGWNKTELYLSDTNERPLRFTRLTTGLEHTYGVQVLDDALWILTNEKAPRYALYRADVARPTRTDWQLVIKEHDRDVFENFEIIGGQIFASYSQSAISRVEHFDDKGASLGAIDLPSIGSNSGFSGLDDGDEALLDFESFASPRSIHRFDLESGELSLMLSVPSSVDPDAFSITRRTARSKDGTRVPYVIVARKETPLSGGDQPTLLYGYGGFNLSLTPSFSRTNYAFLERGGVYVQANLRGGGEFGESWHRAGQLGNKQNVFDDFIAVAEALIDTGVTNPNRLAIYGRSNGGLLIAATITQRPELFRAAVSAVPLTDMVRYPKFLIAKLWVPEYGSPEDPDQFKWLYAYSPYHHVKPRSPYPATLFMTAESDTRVDPAHARKMTAELQAQNTSSHPILLRTEVEAGHGAGKPVSKVAEEYADLYSFVMSELGMKPPGQSATKR